MPCTSAVSPSTSIEVTPPRPETSRPGAVLAVRGRKRFEVFFARRTVWPVGRASYDARRRATASSWAVDPVTTDGNLLPSRPERRGGPVEWLRGGRRGRAGRGRRQVAGGCDHAVPATWPRVSPRWM